MLVPEFNCRSVGELHEQAGQFALAAGFSSFGFAAEVRAPDALGVERFHFVHDTPSAWRESIESSVLAGRPHNLVRHASLMLPPVGWSRAGHLAGHTIVDELAWEHVALMEQWSVNSGALCPVAAPELEWGALAFFSQELRCYEDLTAVLPQCTLFSANFCFWYAQLAIRAQGKRRAILSSREIECLQYAANGKTSIEIGLILSISARTVEGYITASCAKLNARGRQAAISKATEMQLIGGRNSLTSEFARQRDIASQQPIASQRGRPG